MKDAAARCNKVVAIPMLLSLVAFLAIGSTIYYQNNIANETITDHDVYGGVDDDNGVDDDVMLSGGDKKW